MKKKYLVSLIWLSLIFLCLSSRTAFSQNANIKIIGINIEDSNLTRYFWCTFFKTLAKSDNIFIEIDDRFKQYLSFFNFPFINNNTILLRNDIPCTIPIRSSSEFFIEVQIFRAIYDNEYEMSIVTKNLKMNEIDRFTEKISKPKDGDYFFTIIDLQKAILKFFQKFDASITENWIK